MAFVRTSAAPCDRTPSGKRRPVASPVKGAFSKSGHRFCVRMRPELKIWRAFRAADRFPLGLKARRAHSAKVDTGFASECALKARRTLGRRTQRPRARRDGACHPTTLNHRRVAHLWRPRPRDLPAARIGAKAAEEAASQWRALYGDATDERKTHGTLVTGTFLSLLFVRRPELHRQHAEYRRRMVWYLIVANASQRSPIRWNNTIRSNSVHLLLAKQDACLQCRTAVRDPRHAWRPLIRARAGRLRVEPADGRSATFRVRRGRTAARHDELPAVRAMRNRAVTRSTMPRASSGDVLKKMRLTS